MSTERKYILAIDGGTQSTKVALFDLEGHQICSHTVKLRPMDLYGDNRAEHPDDDLWDSLQLACQTALGEFEGDRADIVGVGLGSIRCCRTLIREDGTLAAPVQNWMDLRLSRPYEHEDDTVRWVTTTTGYLTHRLTGQTRDTRANYVGPWPIDPVTLDWHEDAETFASFTTPREMLFDLVDPCTILGQVTASASAATGIPEGVPVVSTANDKAVEGLGAGILNDGAVLVSLGTYIASMMVGEENSFDTQSYFSNPGAVPGQFLYESGGIRRGMSTVTWVMDLMGGDVVAQAEERGLSREAWLNQRAAKEVAPGCDGLITILNWLASPNSPHERGMMIGFNGVHTGIHMFRSTLEGIAMTMRNHVQAMCDEREIEPSKIVVSGGGSNGELFMQIFADVFGVPAHRNEVNGSASMGAAICTALALGFYKDPVEAIEAMVRPRDMFAPIPENVALYGEINEKVYKRAVPQTDAILKASYQLFHG
ncbi:FGGY-family carbohydrate kinase [Tropicimonas sp. TH_r6]|uniref:FGGY-family carbohydrate kinase n=1 Tax=Tropicimonas sp. TH_r6 TaxID=3082085 RepID=UPI002954AD52|nr:FGGY-family carbohydrate kinase [Tropicimonas sp. TH_r6]MDV7142543.1 FGGY-family carbohydrate kinase [Tropicimonas sp. TH_r6]